MPHLNDKAYMTAKYLVQIGLPAVATAYFAIAQIWGLSHPEQIVGTITALNTGLGLLLGINTKIYNNSDAKYDGVIKVDETEDKKVFTMDLQGKDPEEIVNKPEVTFKVDS